MRPAALRALLYAAALLAPLTISAVFAFQPWVEPRWAFMDTISAADLSGEVRLYYGFVSNLGVLGMAATAAVALFAAACRSAQGASEGMAFLLGAGLVSGWLALDDLYLLHEALLPRAGVRQEIGVAFAGLLVLGHVVVHRRRILAAEWPLMMAALLGFGASAGLDLVVHTTRGPWIVAEDAAKFVAIGAWTAFHVDAALRLVTGGAAAPRSRRPAKVAP